MVVNNKQILFGSQVSTKKYIYIRQKKTNLKESDGKI